MRDDDTLDDQQLAPASTGRTDENLSSEQGGKTAPGYTAQPRPGLTDLLTRTRLGAAGDRVAAVLRGVPKLFGDGEKARVAIAAGAICCLGLASFAQTSAETTGGTSQPDVYAAYSERAETEQAADRSMDRGEGTAPEVTAPTQDPDLAPSEPAPEEQAPEEQAPEPAPAPEPEPQPVDPGPVAGLTVDQMNNAKAIVRTGRDMGVERRGLIIAVATAMQESNLYNLASGVVPESMNHPNQGIGWDHDSVGLFQQRASTGWGPVHKLMDPAYSTQQFLHALQRVPGWQQMRLTAAAQAVQVSAYPEHYAKHESRATEIVDAIVPGWN